MDPLFYFNQGLEKYRSQDFHGAIHDFTKAIELNSSITKRTITEKRPDGSTESTNIFDICEGDVNTYYNRGCAYYDAGMYSEALQDFAKVIEYSPDDASAYFKRGLANYCLQNDWESENDFANAYKLDPKYSPEYFQSLFAR